MRFVILTSKPNSPYADTTRSYEYPRRYQRLFQPLNVGEPMIAIIYGPDDESSRRMAFIGWAALNSAPRTSARATLNGEPQWIVDYVDDIQYFPVSVPFRIMGDAMERWVREWQPGTPDMRGRSVRYLEESDARHILELGYAGSLPVLSDYGVPDQGTTNLAAERATRLVEAVMRDAGFRRDVVRAYDSTCAVTGLSAVGQSRRRVARLLDAAHIRPVNDKGPDIVGNGLALTPTVHRLFDAGLITIRWFGDDLQLATSPDLDSRMVSIPERGIDLGLHAGAGLILPSDRALWPKADLVRYHQTKIFRGPPSILDSTVI